MLPLGREGCLRTAARDADRLRGATFNRRHGGLTAWGKQHHRGARPDARAHHRAGRAERGDAPLSQPRGKRHRRTNRSAESGKRQRAVHCHATGSIETHPRRSLNWENGAPGPREGPRRRSANCGNNLFAQYVRLRSEIDP